MKKLALHIDVTAGILDYIVKGSKVRYHIYLNKY